MKDNKNKKRIKELVSQINSLSSELERLLLSEETSNNSLSSASGSSKGNQYARRSTGARAGRRSPPVNPSVQDTTFVPGDVREGDYVRITNHYKGQFGLKGRIIQEGTTFAKFATR